jgi:hypothetical protein
MDNKGLEISNVRRVETELFALWCVYLLIIHLNVFVEFFITGLTKHFTEYLACVFKKQFWIVFPFRTSAFSLELARERGT